MKKIQNSTIKAVLYSRKDKDGLYPIKIRITKNQKSKFKNVGYAIRKVDWAKTKRRVKTTHTRYKEINIEIENQIKDLEQEYKSNGKISLDKTLVFDYIQGRIKELREENQYYDV